MQNIPAILIENVSSMCYILEYTRIISLFTLLIYRRFPFENADCFFNEIEK